MSVKGLGASKGYLCSIQFVRAKQGPQTQADMCELLPFPVCFTVRRMKSIIEDSCVKWESLYTIPDCVDGVTYWLLADHGYSPLQN